jgi:hypothetical protein
VHSINLPRKWVAMIQIAKPIFGAYEGLRSYAYSQSTPSDTLKVVVQALDGLRQLLVVIASTAGPIFETVQERMLFSEDFASKLPHVLSLVSAHVSESIRIVEVNDLREKEAEAVAVMLERFLANFQLGFIIQLPSFESLILAIGELTFRVASALSTEAEQHLQSISLGSMPGECALLEGWKGDLVSILLDAWSHFVEDPLLLMATGEQSSLQLQIPPNIKLSVRKVSLDVFRRLFDSVLRVTLAGIRYNFKM